MSLSYASATGVRQVAITPDVVGLLSCVCEAKMTEASSSDSGNALKHLNLSEVSCSHAGSHWSWPPDKLAALLDCPLGA
ncbi:hypothetical protein EMIT0P100_130112 [Pseudomonas sp. IT-P100]